LDRLNQYQLRQLNEAKVFTSPIVATLDPLEGFYVAEVRKVAAA